MKSLCFEACTWIDNFHSHLCKVLPSALNLEYFMLDSVEITPGQLNDIYSALQASAHLTSVRVKKLTQSPGREVADNSMQMVKFSPRLSIFHQNLMDKQLREEMSRVLDITHSQHYKILVNFIYGATHSGGAARLPGVYDLAKPLASCFSFGNERTLISMEDLKSRKANGVEKEILEKFYGVNHKINKPSVKG